MCKRMCVYVYVHLLVVVCVGVCALVLMCVCVIVCGRTISTHVCVCLCEGVCTGMCLCHNLCTYVCTSVWYIYILNGLHHEFRSNLKDSSLVSWIFLVQGLPKSYIHRTRVWCLVFIYKFFVQIQIEWHLLQSRHHHHNFCYHSAIISRYSKPLTRQIERQLKSRAYA